LNGWIVFVVLLVTFLRPSDSVLDRSAAARRIGMVSINCSTTFFMATRLPYYLYSDRAESASIFQGGSSITAAAVTTRSL
jgi:hypothetical protein